MKFSSFDSNVDNQEAKFSLRQKLPSQSIKSHITKKKRFLFIIIKSAFNSSLNEPGYMMVFNQTKNAF